MSNVQSYNALIDRFKAFASGHFILKTFSHGQIDTADLEKFTEYPFMHVVPSNVTYAKGTKTFSFQIVLADLPRDKDDKVEFQREVLSDLQRIAEDLVAEITNHRVLFGDLITVQNVSLEPFLEEFHNTLTGWTVSLELLVPYYWDACSIPAEWNDMFESGSGGTGSILTFIDSITRDENGNVSLVNDEAEPSPNYYYGTNDEGVRGWYLLTDELGLTCATIGTCQTIIDIESAIDDLQTEILLKANTADISAVGFSNDYNDLDNKPTIPDVSGFVTYVGATTDVDLGTYNLTADHIALNVSPSGAGYVVGATQWNNTIGSSETLLKGGSVSLKNGVDLVARVVNKVTPNTTLTKAAYQAVRVSGAQGQRLAVALAQANNDNNSADTIGIVCETIATNQEGFIQTVGQLESINTTGSLQGETWADGDVLYLSPTTAGALTNIKPTGATGHIVVIGYVEYAHANNGKIYVKIMNGWELDELHNVYITSPANNQGLFYDSADQLWKNETIASALGYTPENAANKQNSLAVDGTGVKFPTVDAVNNLSLIDRGKRVVSFLTDFIGNVLNLDGLAVVVNGGSITAITFSGVPQRTNQIGVHSYNTLALAVNYAHHLSAIVPSMCLGNGAWVFETSINLSNLSTSLERFRTLSGFGGTSGAGVETDGVFITYDEGGTQNGTAASPNWQCVTVANSVRTLTTTSTAVVAAGWIKLRIEINAAGTSAAFYVNGTLIATHTTNIPLGTASRFLFVKQGMYKTIGLTNRIMYVDYLGYENILTTPR
jgi:hypothetical protein